MNRNLLDRKSEYPDHVKLSDLIDRTIDFGIKIYGWDIEENGDRKGNIVCQTFFKNILEIGDGISILIQKSSIENAKILLRSLVENLFYLEYLLEADSKNRALAYLVATFHSEINFYSRMDTSTEMGITFRRELKKDRVFSVIPFKEPQVDPKATKEDLLRILTYPFFTEIEKEYQKTLMKKSNPPWYSLWNGPSNVEQLAKHLNLHALYEILYRAFSESVHSSNVIKNNLIDLQHGSGLGPMRNPEGADMIASLTLTCLEMVYHNFVEKRIPAKATEYDAWHLGFSKDFDKLRVAS